MPHLPLAQLIILSLSIFAFAAFGVVLLAVSLWMSKPDPARPIPREVIPASRARRTVETD